MKKKFLIFVLTILVLFTTGCGEIVCGRTYYSNSVVEYIEVHLDNEYLATEHIGYNSIRAIIVDAFEDYGYTYVYSDDANVIRGEIRFNSYAEFQDKYPPSDDGVEYGFLYTTTERELSNPFLAPIEDGRATEFWSENFNGLDWNDIEDLLFEYRIATPNSSLKSDAEVTYSDGMYTHSWVKSFGELDDRLLINDTVPNRMWWYALLAGIGIIVVGLGLLAYFKNKKNIKYDMEDIIVVKEGNE